MVTFDFPSVLLFRSEIPTGLLFPSEIPNGIRHGTNDANVDLKYDLKPKTKSELKSN